MNRNQNWNQSTLIKFITLKKPVTRAMASAIVQEVFDFVALGLILNKGPICLPRLGQFEVVGNDVVFTASAHLKNLLEGHRSTEEACTNG